MSDPADAPVIRRSDVIATSMALAEAAGLELSTPPLPALALWGAYDGDQMVGTVMLSEWHGLPIGPLTAARLLAEAGDARRFRSAAAFAMAAGVAPSPPARARYSAIASTAAATVSSTSRCSRPPWCKAAAILAHEAT